MYMYQDEVTRVEQEYLKRSKSVPKGAVFSVGVTDDIMSPYLKPGGNMYVSRDCGLRDGEVGLFFVGDRLVCRQYAEDSEGNIYLFAANRARRDADITVPASSGVTVACLGKVILPENPPLPGDE